MYVAVAAMIAQSKELEQLAAGSHQPQPQQPQRRLMSADSSSASRDDDRLVEPFALASDSSAGRHLLQAPGDAAAGSTPTPGVPTTASSGGITPGSTPGVETDPSQQGLTQEALESFKIFDDVPADAANEAGGGGGAAAAADDQASVADGAGVVGGAGVGGDAAAAAGQQGTVSDATLTQEAHHTRGADYDEFGDSWKSDLWQQAQGESPPWL